MTSPNLLRQKLMLKLMELPDCKRHEQAPGMGMTWWQISVRLLKSKRISDVKALLRRAEEVGLIRKRTGVMPHAG